MHKFTKKNKNIIQLLKNAYANKRKTFLSKPNYISSRKPAFSGATIIETTRNKSRTQTTNHKDNRCPRKEVPKCKNRLELHKSPRNTRGNYAFGANNRFDRKCRNPETFQEISHSSGLRQR